MTVKGTQLYLPDIVGKGYATFWNFKGRYRVVKGSRASKKSKTMALWLIVNMIKYPEANAIVVRKTYRTLKDSCFAELKWAIHRLQVDEWWSVKESPLEMTYNPTGQTIYFRGLDDPFKITSVAVEHGSLCWMWIEEAYEITSEDDFDTIDESIRGTVPDGLFKQVTLTFNPWNERSWLKRRFFDNVSVGGGPGEQSTHRSARDSSRSDVLAMTTNYMCNEWLDESDIDLFETMKRTNPRRYRVAGLGDWGIVDGLVYENWKEQAFEVVTRNEYLLLDEADRKRGNYVFHEDVDSIFGLDFGYTHDPTALFCGYIDQTNKKIYVFDELYEKGLSNRKIYQRIEDMGYAKEKITADSAEPKSIDELRMLGLRRIVPALKGKDSINHGIQFIQDYEIIVHPRCVNFITEISNYAWDKDKTGRTLKNSPIDDFNHLMDAMRYAVERFTLGRSHLNTELSGGI